MISVAEAEQRILAGRRSIGTEFASLDNAIGRVLAAPARAGRTHPPHDLSAMDGYAVRSADVTALPTELKVVAQIPAGTVPRRALGPGEAARIFTGAVLPEGADAIVIQENTEAAGDRVRIVDGRAETRFVRRAGYDFREGEDILPAGRRLTPQDLGLAAAANVTQFYVHRRPRVAFLATGNELVPPGTVPGPSQIVASTGIALKAMIEAWGGTAVDLGIAADTLEDIREKATLGLSRDVLVTLGGASVGDHDLVKPALAPFGFQVDFWKIAMRPGKPLMSGSIRETVVLGLPGNPVSSLVCAILFLQPLIRTLGGEVWGGHHLIRARLGCDLKANDQRQDYLRAGLERTADGLVATPFQVQDSGNLSAFSRADGLVLRSPHAPATPAGTLVDVLPLAQRY